MKRLISKYDENYYTYMLKIINSIGGRSLKYNWLITDIEAYPNNEIVADKIDKEYVILSNDELIDILEQDDFQWIRATFSAISANISKDEILRYILPSTDKVKLSYNSESIIQHPLATIEIDCMDSSFFAIIYKDETIEKGFLKAYPKAIKSIEWQTHF